jgi:hypothetical protein
MLGTLRAAIGVGSFLSFFFSDMPARAAALPFEATLEVHYGVFIPGEDRLPHLTVTGTGVAMVNGSGGGGPVASLALPAGFVTGGDTVVVTDPAAYPIKGLILDGITNDPGSFGGGGALGGVMGIPGVLKVCLFAGCGAAVANLVVPLTPVGVGGTALATAAVNLTVVGAPWTTGTAMLTGLGSVATIMGSAQGPASAPGSTALPGGTLSLVTPILIHANITPDGPIGAYAVLRLEFVPEPATLVLLGAGVALLAALGRRRS